MANLEIDDISTTCRKLNLEGLITYADHLFFVEIWYDDANQVLTIVLHVVAHRKTHFMIFLIINRSQYVVWYV